MGKITNILLGASLVGLCFLGWCTRKGSTKINEQKETIDSLETKVEKYSGFAKQLKEKVFFYSDSLGKTLGLYNGSIAENEKLNKKVGELSKRTNKNNYGKDNKYSGLQGKYNSLANEYAALENEKGKVYGLYQKEISKNKELNSLLGKNSASTEKGYSNIRQSTETKKKYNAKNENLLRNWKSISPRFFSVGEESVSFKDNSPESMEAFARYETGRLIPLKKIEDSDKCSVFYLPHIDFHQGTIYVYAVDKDGNSSREHPVYILDGIVSKKKID
ncbi:MAG TPA: hypothetical protein VJA20_03410 [Candidatus Nanoarchaeia archaeon]|nr:hypothetical protein [Candidatus Nanoarchaeia archaeon]